MGSQLTCGCEVCVAVVVEVFGDDLRAYAGGAVHGDGDSRKRGVLAVDLVGVDDDGIVGAGVVAGMAAVALAGDELGLAIAVDVGELKCVGLGEGLVDGVALKFMVGGLFEPVEAVTVALAVDDVGAAVVVDVVGEDWEACVSEMPVGVPLPFVVVGVDVLEPAVGG